MQDWKRHTNLIKVLLGFAKTAYLFAIEKVTYYCLISIHIIAYQWFEDTKRKVNNTH
jgi:hypothetical protein